MRRAVLTVLAVLCLALAGAASVRAAEPLIGGKLAAGGGHVTYTSTSTMTVRVTFEGEAVTVSPAVVIVEPGQTVEATYPGDSVGKLSAHIEAVNAVLSGGDMATATLVVNLKPYTPPFPWAPVGTVLLGLAGAAIAARRLRLWELRIHRAPG